MPFLKMLPIAQVFFAYSLQTVRVKNGRPSPAPANGIDDLKLFP